MQYDYYHFNHIGSYHCENCGHHKHDTQFTVTEADLEKGYVVVNGKDKISLALRSMYNVYNVLAAYTVASLLGIPEEEIAKDISNYILKNGRVVTFRLGTHTGTLLASKHENSISYDQSIQLAVNSPKPCTVLIIVDAISRKYFTSEVSWLWDIDFEKLADNKIARIVLAGRYCNCLLYTSWFCRLEGLSFFVKRPGGQRIRGEYAFCVICWNRYGLDTHLQSIERLLLSGVCLAVSAPVSYTHLDVYKRQHQFFIPGKSEPGPLEHFAVIEGK